MQPYGAVQDVRRSNFQDAAGGEINALDRVVWCRHHYQVDHAGRRQCLRQHPGAGTHGIIINVTTARQRHVAQSPFRVSRYRLERYQGA